MNTEQLKTAKQLIQERLGSNVVFSIDGQMIGDINAQAIVVLMQDFANQEIKRAVEKDRIDPMKETEQTLLESIKDQAAREVSVYSAMNAKEFIELELIYAAQHEFINLVCERYATAKAQASCEATLKKASENAKVLPGGPSFEVDKDSITDTKNITIG